MWFIRIKRLRPLSWSLLKSSLKFSFDRTYVLTFQRYRGIREWIRWKPAGMEEDEQGQRRKGRREEEREELNYVLEKNFLRRSNDREISEGNCVWQTADDSPCSLFTKAAECVFRSLSNLPYRDSRSLFQRESLDPPNLFYFYRKALEFRARERQIRQGKLNVRLSTHRLCISSNNFIAPLSLYRSYLARSWNYTNILYASR